MFVINHYVSAFQRYADFGGRSTRSEFWCFVAINLVVMFFCGYADGSFGFKPPFEAFMADYGPISLVYLLVVTVPYIAVCLRRLRDAGFSGWWLVTGLLPFLGFLILLFLFVQKSSVEVPVAAAQGGVDLSA